MITFRTSGRVRFSEVDPYGHVNTEAYVGYFVEHRLEGMRETLGLNLDMLSGLPVAFYTKSMTIEFLHPLRAEEQFTIASNVGSFTDHRCVTTCIQKNAEERTVAECKFVFVCIDKSSGKPTSWPADLLNRFGGSIEGRDA